MRFANFSDLGNFPHGTNNSSLSLSSAHIAHYDSGFTHPIQQIVLFSLSYRPPPKKTICKFMQGEKKKKSQPENMFQIIVFAFAIDTATIVICIDSYPSTLSILPRSIPDHSQQTAVVQFAQRPTPITFCVFSMFLFSHNGEYI